MKILNVRHLGRQPYLPVFEAMKAFTEERDENTADEIWWVEHDPVFTQGQAGKPEHLLNPGDIPVVQVDRGGQVTYHGPGQIVGYPMFNVKRLGASVRELVSAIENAMVEALEASGIKAYARPDAPGVYVADQAGNHMKIGSLGIRVRRGCSYHGLSLNVDMNMEPFLRINPCGYMGLEMTQVKNLVENGELLNIEKLQELMLSSLVRQFAYDDVRELDNPTAILTGRNNE